MILVCGGAGYIGSVLSRKLLEAGFKVRVFDKFYFGKKPLSPLLGRIETVAGDIRDFREEILDGVETVIHLAGLSNDPTSEFNPQANHQINTVGTTNLAKAAKKKGVARFVFASSCSIYDFFNGDDKIKDEESHVDPIVPYSLSKFAAEGEIRKLASDDFCVVILRKGTVFGFSPRMRFDLVVNTMVKDAFSKDTIYVIGDGLHWRPLVDVGDVASAYQAALGAPQDKVNGQIFNISLDNFQVKEIAKEVKEALSKNFSVDPKIEHVEAKGKIRSYRVSNKKAGNLLRFTPKTTIEQSVRRIATHIKNGDIADFDNSLYYNIDWMKPIFEKET